MQVMSKNRGPVGAYAKAKKAWLKRGQEVIRMYEREDLTFRKIGTALGVSPQRAAQLYHEAKARSAKAEASDGR
jgi:DNA-directed RNA polymerase specialized sigma subunit